MSCPPPEPKPKPIKSPACYDPLNSPERAKRRCTECGNWFDSKSPANRKCENCCQPYYPAKPPRYNR